MPAKSNQSGEWSNPKKSWSQNSKTFYFHMEVHTDFSHKNTQIKAKRGKLNF